MKKCISLTCRSIFSDRLRSKFRAVNNNQALCVADVYALRNNLKTNEHTN
jgi:hypothetical protein